MHAFIRKNVYAHVCACIYIYISIYVCVCVFLSVYIYDHMYTHTTTHAVSAMLKIHIQLAAVPHNIEYVNMPTRIT